MANKNEVKQGHIPRSLFKDWKFGGVKCEDIDWKNRIFTFSCAHDVVVYDENDAENMNMWRRELIDSVDAFVRKKAVEAFVATSSENTEEAPSQLVKSNGTWAPQNYLGLVTGSYYFLKHNQPPVSEIKMLLKANGKKLRNYPFDRIDLVVQNKVNVVLVDCSHYKGDEYITDYQWFEVDCIIDPSEWN